MSLLNIYEQTMLWTAPTLTAFLKPYFFITSYKQIGKIKFKEMQKSTLLVKIGGMMWVMLQMS